MPDPKADDNVATEDNVELILRGPDGEIKQVVTAHNLVTTVGKEKLPEQLIASPGTEKPEYIAVGKTETAPVVGNTALGEEAGIFAASTSGSMYARLAFEVINVGAGDSLEIKLTLEYT